MRTTTLPRPGAGWLRATVPGRDLPAPESVQRRWAIRILALVALATTTAYLVWRTTATLDLSVWWLSVPLVLLELHAALGIALFTFSLWDVDRRPETRRVTDTTDRLAVLIPTYNEGIEVLMPTVAAALAMQLPHETWVLDDGARPEVRRLARDLGAHYLARTEHAHAKAGNLNNALTVIDADFVAVLDADHVASPRFLAETLGYFDDSRVALVQTPQEFYNVDSFEHEAAHGTEGDRFHEQALFYRVLQPGKNRWGAAFWCGTGAVVRVQALRAVGGVATDTITEDIHTTIRLHRAGWKTVYHNEVLARGLAASDAATYQLQRLRWGTGAMQVLRIENPLTVPGLRLGQRLAYAATLLGWFDAWRSLGYLLLPTAVLVTGAVPIRADPMTFLVAFGSTFILQQLALRALSRGCHRPILSILFELVRMTPNLLATTTLVTRRRVAFAVTPKGRSTGEHGAVQVPFLLLWAAALNVFGAAWFALTLLGVTPTRYPVMGVALGALAWLVVNVVLSVAAMRRVRALRYAPERRASVRFETDLPASLDGARAVLQDVSLTGARIVVTADPDRRPLSQLTIEIGAAAVALDVLVRSARPIGDGREIVGLEFEPGQHAERARLALAIFGTRIVPGVDGVARRPEFSPGAILSTA